ncbi:MAG TPA: radical SAM protein [Gemmatimonadota bacterium]|nr:radical SAM protein [Gemmatimonadota bacterium]
MTLPHVVAWNLTRRCNLACSHCYIAAGSWHAADEELPTADCRRIADEILEVNPRPLVILSGGEPLLREDLEETARHLASRGATVVVGTNGTRLTVDRIETLKQAGVQGVAVSVDSLDPVYHDRFRHGDGALEETLAAVERLRKQRLDFIVQTSVTRGNRAEIPGIAEWAAGKGAVGFNVYFLVQTGRGAGMRGLTPAENEEVLAELVRLEARYRGRMMVRSKCMPQIMRHVHARGGDSPLMAYSTRCPCGVQYCRITPEGRVTPCPYLPVEAGDLTRQSFREVWTDSPVFARLRSGALGGKCGRCEYRAVCGGCRARAFADTGDYLAADHACVYEPTGDRELVRPAAVAYGDAGAWDDPTIGDATDTATRTGLQWTSAARERLDRVPSFVRGVVAARVEAFARERGYREITEAVLDEVRRSMPVDFSKRRPYFARDAVVQGSDVRDDGG